MLLALLTSALALAGGDSPQQTVVVVVGNPGNDEYGDMFRSWAEQWQKTARRADARWYLIGQEDGTTSDRQLLKELLDQEANESPEPLWLVFIGHGTFDGQAAKFNLRGPDVSAKELAEWLGSSERPMAIVNCASASAPFINYLAAPNRVIVTSTRSGAQYNFSRFGRFVAAAIDNAEADLDKDEQVSLLEAFLMASSQVQEFYDSEDRLATEHALIDDNGDGRGTPADWFEGVRAVGQAAGGAAVDGLRANQLCLVRSSAERQLTDQQRARRDALEAELESVRERKEDLPSDEYYAALERVLVQLAEIYVRSETDTSPSDTPLNEPPPSGTPPSDNTPSDTPPSSTLPADPLSTSPPAETPPVPGHQ